MPRLHRTFCGAALAGLLALTALAFAAATQAARPRSPQQWFEQAVRLHAAGRLDEAIREYRAFLEKYPNVADVYSNLGAAYAAKGDIAAALKAYEEAVKLGNASDPVALQVNLGLAYFKTARFEEATAAFERALQHDPQNYQAALLLADCYFRAGKYGEVIALLSPFEDLHGEDPALIYLLGTSLIQEGEAYRGQLLVDRIFRKGESVEAHLMLGTAHLMAQDWPSAALEFEKALQLDPKRPTVNRSYALALREMSRIDEAAEYFRKELELNPYDYESNLFLGIHLYKHMQQYDQALELLSRALQVRPGDVDARYHMGLVYVLRGDTQKALELLEGVVREVPDYMEGHVALARLYFRLGRREDAMRERQIVERIRAERDAATPKGLTPEERAQTGP